MKLKSKFKQVLSILLTAAMLLALLPSAALAAHDVTSEAGLRSAIAGASGGDTIRINADITLTSNLLIDKSVTLTSDNASTLNATNSYYIDIPAGVFAAFEGDLIVTGASGQVINADGDITLGEDVSVIQTGANGTGIYINDDCTATIGGNAKVESTDQGIYNAGTLSVSGGSVNGKNRAIGNWADLTISGGVIGSTDKDQYGILVFSGTANISGGSTFGLESAVFVSPAGTVNISGGSFAASSNDKTALGCRGTATLTGGNFTTGMISTLQDGAAIHIDLSGGGSLDLPASGVSYSDGGWIKRFLTALPGAITATVGQQSDVSLTGSNGEVVYAVGSSTNAKLGAVSSGATAVSMTPTAAGSYKLVLTAAGTGLAGAQSFKLTLPVTVSTDVAAVCEIGATGYATLGGALAAVTSGQTIRLLEDITHTEPIAVDGKVITFDLGDYDLSLDTSANAAKRSEPALTVTGGGKVGLAATGAGKFNVTGYAMGVSVVGVNSEATVNDVTVMATEAWAVYMGGSGMALDGGRLTVNGDIKAEASNSVGIEINAKNGKIIVNGNVAAGRMGVSTSANLGTEVTVNGNVSVVDPVADSLSQARGIYANPLTTVHVTGNVSVTGADCLGLYANAAMITVNGNVTSFGIGAKAVRNDSYGNGMVTIDGCLSAGSPFVIVGSSEKNVGQDTIPTTKEGYLTYTDGNSTVWAKTAQALTAPTVTSVTVIPAAVTVQRGNTQSFSAMVNGTNNPAQTVTWSVSGADEAGTAISGSGLLTVAADETAEAFTVTATSTVNPARSGTAAVTVSADVAAVCEIDGTGYATLDGALAVVPTGGVIPTTIKLLKEITLSSQLTIDNKKLTFDLNGHNLVVNTTDYAGLEVKENSNVGLAGTGEFNVTGSAKGVYATNSTVTVTNATAAATNTMSNGTIAGVFALNSNVTVKGNAEGFTHGVYADGDTCSVTVEGSAIGTSNGSGADSSFGVQSNKGTVTVLGSVQAVSRGIYADQCVINVGHDVVVTGINCDGITAADSTVIIGGSINVSGLSAVGVRSGNYSTIRVDNTINSSDLFISFIHDSGLPPTFLQFDPAMPDDPYHTYKNIAGTSKVLVKNLPSSDAQEVAAAKAALTFDTIKGSNGAANNIMYDLNLTTAGINGTTISWDSSNTSYITTGGAVTLPAAGTADVSVTLTATISKGSASDTKTFSLTVKKQVNQDVLDVASAKEALTFSTIKGANSTADNIISDLSLPGTGSNGTTITWTSSNTSYITNGGAVTRPAAGTADVPVTLTATISKGSASDTKTFTIMVKAPTLPSGGGGGFSTPSIPAYQAVVKAGNNAETTIPVVVSKNTETASVNAGSLHLSQGGTVITVPSIPGVYTYSVGIPVPDLSTTVVQGTLTLNTSLGSVTVPSNMLTGVQGAGGDMAVISIGAPAKLNLTIDGKRIDWNNPKAPVRVSIPYKPTAAELANPESIIMWFIDGSGKNVTVPNGYYNPILGAVTFTVTHFGGYTAGYNKVSFNDVASNAWYSKAVNFIGARGITSGTGNGNFSPDARLTRGEFIVLIMRAFGITPDASPADNFADAGNTYYTGYLAAAKRLGIAAGAGNNRYAPGKEITRQEMCTLLYNALKTISRLPQGSSEQTFSNFTDAAQIDPWAQEAMAQLVETGMISGSGGRLNPMGTTTRAEMAQVLYNLLGK